MNWTTATMEWDENQAQLRDVNANKLVVRGGHFGIKRSQLGISIIWITTMSSLPFSNPLLRKDLSCYIALSRSFLFYTCWSSKSLLEYPSHQTPVLTFCELWNTVQRSPPHKCGQKSSYSAFNAVVTVFP